MKANYDMVIMDWGIGGLSVYKAVRELMPELSILYFSDAGVTPYGKLSARQLDERIFKLILRFSQQNIRHFVVACNAASTALPRLEKRFAEHNFFVTGVIDRGVELIHSSDCRNVGVIGGKRTILSKSFTRPFIKDKKIRVFGRVAQPLSALIEAGQLNTDKMRTTLKRILAPLKSCDAVVLACTHYPAIAEQIQKILPNARLLDPSMSTALFVQKNWKFTKRKTAKQIFMTSGSRSQMIKSASLAFDVQIKKLEAYY